MDMRALRTFLLALLVLFSYHAVAAAADCGDVPVFSAKLDPNSVPPAPDPKDLPTLETYNAQLKTFLRGVEAYNQLVISHGDDLDAADSDAREALAHRQCSDSDYITLRRKIRNEERKVGGEYLVPYYAALDNYSTWVDWYKKEAHRILNSI